MKVVIKEVGKEAYIHEIDGGNLLRSLQKIVGGYIEPVQIGKIIILVNEEGKLNDLPLNFTLINREGRPFDVVAGTAIFIGSGDEDFRSLTEDEVKQAFDYLEKSRRVHN